MCKSFSRSPSNILSTGMPVQRETMAAMWEDLTASSRSGSWVVVFERNQLPLEVGNNPVGELARARQVAVPLCDLERAASGVELLLDPLSACEALLLGAPDRSLIG